MPRTWTLIHSIQLNNNNNNNNNTNNNHHHNNNLRRGQPSLYGAPGYPPGPPPPMHRSLQGMEGTGKWFNLPFILRHSPHQNDPFINAASPYHNSPYGGFYPPPVHGAPSERRPTMLNTFEQYDNISKSSPSPHDRSTPNAYMPHGVPPHHPGVLVAGSRHPEDDAERSPSSTGAGNISGSATAPGGSSTSEFSGLVSYFSSQQDDLDS